MAIWFKNYTLKEVSERGKGTMMEHLGIELLEIGPEYLSAQMPVDARTKQPIGLLHGGASLALAESIASTAGNLVVDPKRQYCVGLEINANHVGSTQSGYVVGKCTPIHMGKSTQVWETRITQGDRLISISRMTLMVLNKKA